jgi:hypothetical protein
MRGAAGPGDDEVDRYQPGQDDVLNLCWLLAALYYDEGRLDFDNTRDLYISRSWRDSEAVLADFICQQLVQAGFRLIGDALDQPSWDEERVTSIIRSCGGLVSILPDRGQGKTSKYMLRETQIGKMSGLSCLIVAEPAVDIPEMEAQTTIRMAAQYSADGQGTQKDLVKAFGELAEDWKEPMNPRWIFFSTNFDEAHKIRNRHIKKLVERVAAMPCIMGEDIREAQIQKYIIERVREACLVIADISEENLNTCIETGIALGAKRPLHLVCHEPRRKPPFMFRDQQVWYYEDDAQLLGIVHKLVFPYRRRVLNWELTNA